jgi:hypothetical protein
MHLRDQSFELRIISMMNQDRQLCITSKWETLASLEKQILTLTTLHKIKKNIFPLATSTSQEASWPLTTPTGACVGLANVNERHPNTHWQAVYSVLTVNEEECSANLKWITQYNILYVRVP